MNETIASEIDRADAIVADARKRVEDSQRAHEELKARFVAGDTRVSKRDLRRARDEVEDAELDLERESRAAERVIERARGEEFRKIREEHKDQICSKLRSIQAAFDAAVDAEAQLAEACKSHNEILTYLARRLSDERLGPLPHDLHQPNKQGQTVRIGSTEAHLLDTAAVVAEAAFRGYSRHYSSATSPGASAGKLADATGLGGGLLTNGGHLDQKWFTDVVSGK